MRPCDCEDMYDAINKLNEQGVMYNDVSIEVAPLSVFIQTPDCRLRISQRNFKRFAEWYLEDQVKEGEG